MPNLKVSTMSAATSLNAADYFMVIQGGVNKSVTLSALAGSFNSTNDILINPAQNSVDTIISTNGDQYAIVADSATNRIGIGTLTPQQKLHVNGNVQVGSQTTDGVILQSSEVITYTAADEVALTVKTISPLRAITVLNCDTGVNGLFSLATGFEGQVKTIVQNNIDSGATKTSLIDVPAGLGFNTITFNATGDTATLQYVGAISKWIIIGNTSATFSTV